MSQLTYRGFWGCLLLLGFRAAPCQAQYWFNNTTGYNPWGSGYGGYGNQYAGPGGFLHGTAVFISSTADLYIKQEQAWAEREKANQARIQTKKMAFDQMMYEKANTPTYTEEALYKKNLFIHRLMNTPLPAEIIRGETLNIMLPVVQDLSNKGVPGPPIQIDKDLLKEINVTLAGGQASGNMGMLKNLTDLEWPLTVQGPKQEKTAALLKSVVAQVVQGRLKAPQYMELTSQVTGLQEELRKKFHKEEIDGGTYLIGKRFLDSLEGSIKGLQQPGMRKVLTGGYAAKGNNVPELVNNMTSKGLMFAPANPGDEQAYFALHNAFVSYASTAMSNSGFQMRFNPPRTDPFVKN